MGLILQGEGAANWVPWAKSKLANLRRLMALSGRDLMWERHPLPGEEQGSHAYVSSQAGREDIRISVIQPSGLLFIADIGGFYEYHDDLGADHKRYGLKAFDKNLILKKWFDPWGSISPLREYYRYSPAGVSYYKNKVYVVDNWGNLDIFTASGTYIEGVSLYTKVDPFGGKSQNCVHVRGDRIFVSANYLSGRYQAYEFDMEYNYVRQIPGPYGQGSWGSTAIASDPVNNRLYIGQNGYFVGEYYDILVHELDTGNYMWSLPTVGTEGLECGGMSINRGILYSSDASLQRIIRHDLSSGSLLTEPVLDCSGFLLPGMMLQAIAVDDDGIWFSGHYLPKPADASQLTLYIKKISLDGLAELKSEGEFMGPYGLIDIVYGTAPANPYRFNQPGWMDLKKSENP